MKFTLERLQKDVVTLLDAVCAGYDSDPGDSDLDDEQPIWVRIPLGQYRLARRLRHELLKVTA